MPKVTVNTTENHELIALEFYFMLLNIDKVKSPVVKDLLTKIKTQALTPFTKAWLKINTDIRIMTKRLQGSLDGSLTKTDIIQILPDKERQEDNRKKSMLKKAVVKLMKTESNLTRAEHKMMLEHHDIKPNEVEHKTVKTHMKYL